VRPGTEAAANLIRGRMKLCGNPTGSRASIVWMKATVVPMPMPAEADAAADAVEMMTAAESEWLSLQLGGAAGPYASTSTHFIHLRYPCYISAYPSIFFSLTQVLFSVATLSRLPRIPLEYPTLYLNGSMVRKLS